MITDLGSVVGSTKDELRGPVVSRADIRDVGLICDQDFGATEVTELEYAGIRIKQKILRFDISMTDTLRVDVRQGAEELVDVYLDLENGHGGLHLIEEA